MRKILVALLAAMLLMFQGCINLKDDKTLTVHIDPDKPKSTAVTSTATVKCRDFLVFWRCTIDTTLSEVN